MFKSSEDLYKEARIKAQSDIMNFNKDLCDKDIIIYLMRKIEKLKEEVKFQSNMRRFL